MAKAKKSTTVGYVATLETAPGETPPTPGADQTGPKRKGKAPGKKTVVIRAGIAAHPNLLPKELAERLNTEHPGFNITNNDISQQRQQLKLQDRKSSKKKGKKVVAGVEAVAVKAAPAKAGGDIHQVADLVKQLGTAKVRELCDLIDHISK